MHNIQKKKEQNLQKKNAKTTKERIKVTNQSNKLQTMLKQQIFLSAAFLCKKIYFLIG